MTKLEVLIFDIDGTFADTEDKGHRVAFNQTFTEAGLDIFWDTPAYKRILVINDGRERIAVQLRQMALDKKIDHFDEYVRKLHRRKTDIVTNMMREGQLPIRKGVKRIIEEAHHDGVRLAIASTSNEQAVNGLVKAHLGEEMYGWFEVILAGDVVSKRKPDPAIYNLASTLMKVPAENFLAVEDSRNGLLAAKAAGMKCLVTTNIYTEKDDLSDADLVVDSLGEEGDERVRILSSKIDLPPFDYITLDILKKICSE